MSTPSSPPSSSSRAALPSPLLVFLDAARRGDLPLVSTAAATALSRRSAQLRSHNLKKVLLSAGGAVTLLGALAYLRSIRNRSPPSTSPSKARSGTSKTANTTPEKTGQLVVASSEAKGGGVQKGKDDSKEVAKKSGGGAVGKSKGSGSGKVAVDRELFERLRFILKICIPNWRHKTALIVALHTVFLVLRTYLSVVVARLDGKLVKDMVAADGKEFLKGLGYWFAIAIPATYTNSMIRYLQSKLAIALRTSLTRHVHELYMERNTYYKALNLDNRIQGADQLITTDINRFCNAAASLYSNLGKPLLDIIIFNYQLARSIGLSGMWGLSVNYFITASIMRAITPGFGKLAAEEAKLEGDFRTAHSRLITNAEEIAFYNGAHLEKSILNRTYNRLIKHINHVYKIRIAYNMFEDFIIKYSWSAVGLIIASIPVFFPEWAGGRTKREEALIAMEEAQEMQSGGIVSVGAEGTPVEKVDRKTGSRTQGFITNKRLMMSLADAGGRIMYSYKELSELAGYTFRVYNMLKVMQDLHDDRFVDSREQKAITDGQERFSIADIIGEVDYGFDGIRFEHSPIVTPNGDTVLVRDLSLTIKQGDHLMVTGGNGAGKTSIVRVISGLWPIFRGKLARPEAGLSNIMYIPQRPYLSIGTLRDQIIYPHTWADMKQAGKTDQDLLDILKLVYLDYIPVREGGMDAIKEWKDVFSGGEKQRIQMARLFYHLPQFVILDEATSAVSPDVEALMYGTAKEEGITIITISHRPSLFKYHQYLLRIGEGPQGDAWALERIGTGASLMESVEGEIRKIKERLSGVGKLRERLDEINRELQLEVVVGAGGRTDQVNELKHAKRTLV
ncbi:hypothetical protein HK102_003876 [Quaeritorhiza haematococci]|nr:hypothetical protein HK102_003876 [Quaeritorhiza haematococci]